MSNSFFDVQLAEEDSCSADGAGLIAAAGAELDRLYPEINGCPLDPAELAVARSSFLIARVDGQAVGCGGVRPLSTTVCELKRMYVVPEMRRRGIARTLLFALEQKARDLCYEDIWLETGVRQPQAIAMYQDNGYTEMHCYGRYEGDGWSVCFRKKL